MTPPLTLEFKTLDDIETSGKRVLVRADMNCSIDPETKGLTDISRIRALRPTLHDLSDSSDHYGVHTNCGVPNKMFYLLSEGGTFNGTTVTGIGIENAINIMYYTNRNRWPSNCSFYRARLETEYAALKLESDLGEFAIPTIRAWGAVGVKDTTCFYIPGDCDGDGNAGTVADYKYIRAYIQGQPVPSIPDSCETPDTSVMLYVSWM